MIIWVIGGLRRTVVGDWRFDNLCGSHLQSEVIVLVSWKFKNPGERFDWSIDRVAVGKRVSQDSNHPDDHFQSRYVTPGFKSFSYLRNVCILIGLEQEYFRLILDYLHESVSKFSGVVTVTNILCNKNHRGDFWKLSRISFLYRFVSWESMHKNL